MTQSDVIRRIIYSRYRRMAHRLFDELESISPDINPNLILNSLETEISTNQKISDYSDNSLKNQKILTSQLLTLLDIEREKEFKSRREQFESVKVFMIDNNQIIKYSTGNWILHNVGVGLEILDVYDTMYEPFLKWLEEEYDVHVGDKAIQRHVISNEDREYYRSLGLDVPFEHWSEEYYKDAMSLVQSILKQNENLKGVISDGSWIYSPKIYELAPDGRPFVSFSFFNDKKYMGNIFFMGAATSENQFNIDYKRRRKYVENDLLLVEKYGSFIPTSEVLSNSYK